MTTHRIDRILLALGAALILISSYQLFMRPSQTARGEKLGTLTSALSVVKTKSALALDWRDATIGNALTENQLIYTDNASGAEVVFNEGNALVIGENSLVKLRTQGNDEALDISKGFIRAKLTEDQPLKVQMNGEDYLVTGDGADIQINLQGNKGEIGVLKGEVNVSAEGVSEKIGTDTALAIDGKNISRKKIYYQVQSPENNSIKYVLNLPANMTFGWTPPEKAKVHLSKKASMENPVIHDLASGGALKVSEGPWYVRVESESGVSLVTSFRVIKETPPEILRPISGDEVTILEGENSEILLQWKGDERSNYLVEWKNPELKSLEVSGPGTLLNIDPSKPFSWRVKVQDVKRPEAIWTNWQDVGISFIPAPLIPSELIPDGVEYQTYDKPDELLELSWRGDGKFQVEVKKLEGEITTINSETNHTEFNAKEAGIYSWRVRAQDEYLRQSEWTEWKTFTIQDLSGEKKISGIQRIQLKKPDQLVTFEWKAKQNTKSVFELSKDSDFKTIIKKVESEEDLAEVNIPEVGTYYWRSRQYQADGTLHVSEPRKVIIEPVAAPTKPDKLPDMEIPLEALPAKTTFMQTLFSFLIPSAHAEEIKGQVHITLPVNVEAKGYIVRIYRDQGLENLVFEKEIPSKEFSWQNAEGGEYYWQYAVIDFWDRRSLFSDPAKLTIISDLVPAPVRPRLRYPIRKQEIEQKDFYLYWTAAKENSKFKVELSNSSSFKKVLFSETLAKNKINLTHLKLKPDLYYWRIFGLNEKGEEHKSSTGRFVLLPPKEKTLIQDIPNDLAWKKEWKNRAFVFWAPSMDSYEFKDSGEKGEIDGTAMMSLGASGTMFKDKYILNAEIIRQSGEVFEGESYLFQRLLIDGIWILSGEHNHHWGVGIALGQTSGMAYEIQNDEVGSKSVSGLSYGLAFRNFYSWSENTEIQSRVQYLLGEIPQLDLGADLIKPYKNFLLLGGLTYSTREYELNSGKQSSLKLSLGLGF